MTRSVAWFDDDSSVSVAGLAGRWAALARCRFLRKSGNVHTGAAKRWGTREYFRQPGLDRDSRLWLVGQGIHMIGIDARTLDREFAAQIADFKRTSDGRHIWPAHFAGITKEYCQIEKLTNLDQLPQPHGFYVSCLPVKIKGGSAG
jgi:kynurenine formamidase